MELAVFSAWHVAALSRAERLPELAPMLARVRGEADDEDQDVGEQMGAARAIVAAFGEETI